MEVLSGGERGISVNKRVEDAVEFTAAPDRRSHLTGVVMLSMTAKDHQVSRRIISGNSQCCYRVYSQKSGRTAYALARLPPRSRRAPHVARPVPFPIFVPIPVSSLPSRVRIPAGSFSPAPITLVVVRLRWGRSSTLRNRVLTGPSSVPRGRVVRISIPIGRRGSGSGRALELVTVPVPRRGSGVRGTRVRSRGLIIRPRAGW